MVVSAWEDAAKRDRFADCVFITTLDQMHKVCSRASESKYLFIVIGYALYIIIIISANPTIFYTCLVVENIERGSDPWLLYIEK